MKTVLLGFSLFAVLAGPSGADEPKAIDVTQVDLTKAQVTGVGVGPALTALDAAAANHITLAKDRSYGFTTGISPPRGSFRLGVLLADFQVAAQAGARDRTLEACTALLQGLATLDAPEPLLAAVANLLSALNKGVDIAAVAQLARPLLLSHIEAFIAAQGNLTYFQLGEWTETLHLAAAVGSGANKAAAPVDLTVLANALAEQLGKAADTPPGAIAALRELATVSPEQAATPRELEKVLKATETLKSLLG